MAKQVYDLFIKDDSPLQVNIPYEVRSKIIKNYK